MKVRPPKKPKPHGFGVSPPPVPRPGWVGTPDGIKLGRTCTLCRQLYTGPMVEHLKRCGK